MNSKALMLLFIFEALAGLLAGAYIYAQFQDLEKSTGNTFSAGVWTVCGELISFNATNNVVQGQKANFTITFKNCGEIAVYAVANVQIRRGETGENITLAQTPPTLVEAGQTVTFQLQWDTSGYNPGNYRAIAWIEYNSHATNPTDPTKIHVTNEKAADVNIMENLGCGTI